MPFRHDPQGPRGPWGFFILTSDAERTENQAASALQPRALSCCGRVAGAARALAAQLLIALVLVLGLAPTIAQAADAGPDVSPMPPASVSPVVRPSLGIQPDESLMTTRRQPGILTGMPFMAHMAPRTFVDSRGRKIFLANTPSRIISLAPSLTEILYAIGAGDRVVGVTEFCDYPADAVQKPKVGYANPSVERLVALQPDLIVAPTTFIKPDLIRNLETLRIPLLLLASESIEDILAHVHDLGRALNRTSAADALALSLREELAHLHAQVAGRPPVRVLYVLNSQPLITVGPGSFIDQLIGLAGGVNVASESGAPYPRLSMEVVLQRDPEVLLFPIGKSEGVAAGEEQAWHRWTTLTAIKQGRLQHIPSDLLNRPGPRVAQALAQLITLLHPELSASTPAPSAAAPSNTAGSTDPPASPAGSPPDRTQPQ